MKSRYGEVHCVLSKGSLLVKNGETVRIVRMLLRVVNSM